MYVEPAICPIGIAKTLLDIVGITGLVRVLSGSHRLRAVLRMNRIGDRPTIQYLKSFAKYSNSC